MNEPTLQEQMEAVRRATQLLVGTFIAQVVPLLARFGLTTRGAYAWYVAGGLTRCYL